MRLESRKYLYDIQQAVGLLREFTARKTFADYEQDAMLRAAVERQFELIGEALSQLARVDEVQAARISQYQRIIAFRNVLAHQYAHVDNRLVWDIVEAISPRWPVRLNPCWRENDRPRVRDEWGEVKFSSACL